MDFITTMEQIFCFIHVHSFFCNFSLAMFLNHLVYFLLLCTRWNNWKFQIAAAYRKKNVKITSEKGTLLIFLTCLKEFVSELSWPDQTGQYFVVLDSCLAILHLHEDEVFICKVPYPLILLYMDHCSCCPHLCWNLETSWWWMDQFCMIYI